jgi:DNA end-binding protein Ku
MARSIWTGVISFGLVSVPVKVYSATRDHDVSFHQFQKGTSDRIRYQRVNERTGKEVEFADIVKGAGVGGGRYVILDPDELDSVAPGQSRSLDIHRFVDRSEIDPIFYQKTYYLGPGSDETIRTYALLRDAMAGAGRVAIGTLVMRGKEYLAAIRPDDKLLVLETMFFADEIRDPSAELRDVPSRAKARPNELEMAAQLIDSMTGPWQPAEFRDTYTDRVNELIEAKKQGNEVTVAEEAPEPTNVVDLMRVLRASVDAAEQRRTRPTPTKRTPTKTAPAKKTPAKKAPAKKTTAKKTTAKTAPAKKTTARKAPTNKQVPTKKAPTKKTPTKSPAAKRSSRRAA